MVWYTSAAATAAAQRMEARKTLGGEPICTMSYTGSAPDASMIPAGVSKVGTGRSGNYNCLTWS